MSEALENYKQNVMELFTLLDLKEGTSERADQVRADMRAVFCRLTDEEREQIHSLTGQLHRHKVEKGVFIQPVVIQGGGQVAGDGPKLERQSQ
jgi:hypothetical protein